jgi:hypothetical protein
MPGVAAAGAPTVTGGTWSIEHGWAYLLCFDVPFGELRPHSRPEAGKFIVVSHYLGISDDPLGRLKAHDEGRGSVLTGHVREAGIGWVVARVWLDADRGLERRLKEEWAKKWCLRCRAERIMSRRDPAFQSVMEQIRDDFRRALAAARTERRLAGSERAGRQGFYRAARAAQRQLRAARSQVVREWAATHSLRGLRRSVLQCMADDKPVVTLPAAWRRDAARRDQAAAAVAAARDFAGIADAIDLDDPWSQPELSGGLEGKAGQDPGGHLAGSDGLYGRVPAQAAGVLRPGICPATPSFLPPGAGYTAGAEAWQDLLVAADRAERSRMRERAAAASIVLAEEAGAGAPRAEMIGRARQAMGDARDARLAAQDDACKAAASLQLAVAGLLPSRDLRGGVDGGHRAPAGEWQQRSQANVGEGHHAGGVRQVATAGRHDRYPALPRLVPHRADLEAGE